MNKRHPNGFIVAPRSEEGLDLIRRNPNAFALLYIIAMRARWTRRANRFGLTSGQALIGDHDTIGLTEREYRTAKTHLQKYDFATFKATSQGTIATLTSTEVFDVNARDGDEQNDTTATDRRQANDGQTTTNEEGKKETKEQGKLGGEAVASPTARSNNQVDDEEWLRNLKASEAFQGIDVARELDKMRIWCLANHKSPTRRRAFNWLNRCERPHTLTTSRPSNFTTTELDPATL